MTPRGPIGREQAGPPARHPDGALGGCPSIEFRPSSPGRPRQDRPPTRPGPAPAASAVPVPTGRRSSSSEPTHRFGTVGSRLGSQSLPVARQVPVLSSPTTRRVRQAALPSLSVQRILHPCSSTRCAQCTADEREQLGRVFSVAREQRTEHDVEWVFRLFERYASIDFARATLRQMVQAALDEFDVAYRDAPRSADRDFIRDLIPFLGSRDV